MIRLYRGQIALVATVLTALVSVGSGWMVFVQGGVYDVWQFLLLASFMLFGIAALLLAALTYVVWVPKWERDEKRTGIVLGEGRV